jgi:hypothetical protein
MDKTEWAQLAPGIAGSFLSLAWIKGTWGRKVFMVFFGAIASYYGTGAASSMMGLEDGLAGFLVGLFSMTAVNWVFQSWDVFGGMFIEWVRLKLGLPHKDSQ